MEKKPLTTSSQHSSRRVIRAVLFDKDGTLLDFAATWHRIFTTAFQSLGTELGLGETAVKQLQHVSGYRNDGFEPESIVQHMSASGIVYRWAACLDRHDLREQMLQVVQLAAMKPSTTSDLLPGVDSALRYLSAKRYQLGVATADSLESTYNGLTRAGILHYFSFIGCDDGTYPAKPDPSMAREFLRLHQMAADQLLIVGDSVSDRDFARNAGAQFVGITTGYNRFGVGQDNKDGVGVLIPSMHELISRCAL